MPHIPGHEDMEGRLLPKFTPMGEVLGGIGSTAMTGTKYASPVFSNIMDLLLNLATPTPRQKREEGARVQARQEATPAALRTIGQMSPVQAGELSRFQVGRGTSPPGTEVSDSLPALESVKALLSRPFGTAGKTEKVASSSDTATAAEIRRREFLRNREAGGSATLARTGWKAFPEIDETNLIELEERVGRLRQIRNNLDQQNAIALEAGESTAATNKELAEIAGEISRLSGKASAIIKKTAREESEATTLGNQAFQQQMAEAMREFTAGQTVAGQEFTAGQTLAGQEFEKELAAETRKFGLLGTILPLLMQQQFSGPQFEAQQSLREQQFAQESALGRQASQLARDRFNLEQELAAQRTGQEAEQEETALRARQQAAQLIPMLFPDLPIDAEVLAGGIDPGILSVLITLARNRADQRRGGGVMQPTVQRSMRFAGG
jgi:hypothetical protein